MKKVTYTTKNGGLHTDMHEAIRSIIRAYMPGDTARLRADEILSSPAFTDTNVSTFYIGKGIKVTTFVSKLLKDLKITKETFAIIANKIKKEYSDSFQLKAFWGNKKIIGNGVYEPHETCYRTEGENAVCKQWCIVNKRVGFLVLCNMENDVSNYARCLVYFLGGRRILLFNFYFQKNFPANNIYFVEACSKLLGGVHFAFSKTNNVRGYSPLPLYLNAGGILLTTDRSLVYSKRKYKCQECGARVAEHDFFHEEDGSTQYLGCCEDCSGMEDVARCSNCGERVGEDDRYFHNGDMYCSDCYSESYRDCYQCGESFNVNDEFCDDRGNSWCPECFTNHFFICEDCDESYLIKEVEYIGYGSYCHDCAQDHAKESAEDTDDTEGVAVTATKVGG